MSTHRSGAVAAGAQVAAEAQQPVGSGAAEHLDGDAVAAGGPGVGEHPLPGGLEGSGVGGIMEQGDVIHRMAHGEPIGTVTIT